MDVALSCPICREHTTSLKAVKLFDRLWFFGLAAAHRMERSVACPRCVRRKLARRAFANLPTAHVIWPLTVLPVHLFQYLCSFLPGHSGVIEERLVRGG